MCIYIYMYHSFFSWVIVITYHFFQSVVMGIFMDPNLTIPDICLKDAHLSRFMVYTWYISGIYCQLGDYMLPTTFLQEPQ